MFWSKFFATVDSEVTEGHSMNDPVTRKSNLSLNVLGLITAIFVSFLSLPAVAQDGLTPIIDWQERLTVEERLTAFGDDLMGDSIDTHIGSLVFEHTDISLPGNSNLDVSIRRRLTQGYNYDTGIDVEFGDWELVVPKISAVVLRQLGWQGGRCRGTREENFPSYVYHKQNGASLPSEHILQGDEYNNGISVSIPGQASQAILKGRSDQFPSNAAARTTDEWYFTCTNDGNDFIGHAPNGTKYYFDKTIIREYKELATLQQNSNSAFYRDVVNIMASRVEDLNGNWVEYNYVGDDLRSITSNDGRAISIGYNSKGMISYVSANGRRWEYKYRDTDFALRIWDANSHEIFGSSSKIQVLERVIRPDGLFWEFDLDGMLADASPPGLNPCPTSTETLIMKHPNGTIGTFELKDIRHRQSYKILQYTPNSCVSSLSEPADTALSANVFSFDPNQKYTEVLSIRTMSVMNKTLSHSSMKDQVWKFNFEEGDVCNVSGIPCGTKAGTGGHYTEYSTPYQIMTANDGPYESDKVYSSGAENALDYTNWTAVTQPDGTVIKYYYLWNYETMFGGKLIKQEISHDDIVINQTKTVHLQHEKGNYFGVLSPSVPIYLLSTETERDGDTFFTEYSYNAHPSTSNYSFGRPVSTSVYSDVTGSTTPRVTTTEYGHNTDKWILGLPTRIAVNDREVATYQYDEDGQRESQSRYGQTDFLTFEYNDDGTMAAYEDALGRRVEASNWHRGIPQTIIQGAGSDEAITTTAVVDDNGWMTSKTDAKLNTTSFTRDSDMGRLTGITPPTGWDATTITYDFTGGGAVQTITKGDAETTVTYDSMFRTVLEQTEALDTGWVSYVNTTYDALGRVSFKSQPSSSAVETNGVETTYDGLGRVIKTYENVTPFAETTTDYLSDHATKITDPDGNETISYKDGYGDLIKIVQPENTTTEITRNPWGQITQVRQKGDYDGADVNHRQLYTYDTQQRLCRHINPNMVVKLFAYNAAGELTAESSGHDWQDSGCEAPNGTYLAEHEYDALGRLSYTDYAQYGTASIGREYDPNGNLTALYQEHNRDDDIAWYDDIHRVAWTYEYDNANNLTEERLWTDRRIFKQTHDYNADGSLQGSGRTYQHENHINAGYAYAQDVSYTRDGLGRALGADLNGTGGNGSGGFNGTLADTITYHASGAMTAMSYGNGQNFTQTLNARLLPERMTTTGTGGTALDLSYLYNDRGLVSRMDDLVNTENTRVYGYDGQGRLTTATGPWGANGVNDNATYSYDSLGNIREKVLGARSVTMSYDLRNRLSAANDTGETGNRTLSYDTRGNVTWLGGQNFTYNAMNRPTSMGGDVDAVHRYDGHGRRIRTVTYPDEGGYIIRYNVFGATGDLIFNVQIDQSPTDENYVTTMVKMDGQTIARVKSEGRPWNYTDTVTYLHNDHLGSAGSGTHADGSILWREEYSPFGITMINAAANDNQAGFTGHIKDSDTGLNYMQARYYDPVIGRFLSVDPVGFLETGNPKQFNRYAYGWNNPVKYVDPDGLYSYDPITGNNMIDSQGEILYAAHQAITKPAVDFLTEDFVAMGVALSEGHVVAAGGHAVTAVLKPAKLLKKIGGGIKDLFKKGCKGCFVAGTLIDTEDGLRPIEDIEIGDLVWAQDEETGEIALKAVTDLVRPQAREIYTVEILDEHDAPLPLIGTTDDHPWWIKEKGWLRTDQLTTSMDVITRDGQVLEIGTITKTDRIAPAFNLTVADFETYFVGEIRVLVHNCGDTLEPGPFAGEPVPLTRGRANAAEQRAINKAGEENGCHTCGAPEPGTQSGNWIGDHQEAQALAPPSKEVFDGYPHCKNCSARQAGQVTAESNRRRKLTE